MPFNPMDYPLALSPPRFVTDASAWCGHVPFAMALVQMLRPATIVELGTHKGDSYMAFCQAVAELSLQANCTAIDTWTGDRHSGGYGADVLEQLRAVHDPAYGSFSRLLRSTFDDAAKEFAEGSIDLLHIDGLHTYESVRHDFETWLPKMSRRGVVLFHDVAVREGDFGVWRLWEEITRDRPHHFLFEHSFGLGVMAVGDEIPQALTDFLHESRQNPEPIRRFFARLGESVEYAKFLRQLVPQLIQQQNVLNNWRQHLGLAADPALTDTTPAWTQTLNFAARLVRQLDVALVDDLRVRQQMQEAQRKTLPPAEPVAKSSRGISVIICSVNDARFVAANAMYARLLSSVPHEIIRVPDAKSMSEGYNRAVARSRGDVLIFSHDDVEIINADLSERLLKHLDRFDVVGLAGTTLACGPAWAAAGAPYLFGQVTHPHAEGFAISIFGAPDPVIPNAQALDGLFFAVNRRVLEKVRFDESLQGFHFYDIDFTYSAHLAGFRLAIANDIHAIHQSTGKFNEQWAALSERFQQKWAGRMPARPPRPWQQAFVLVRSKEEIWEVVRPAYWDR